MTPPKNDTAPRLHEVAPPADERAATPAPPRRRRLPLVIGGLALAVAAAFGARMFLTRGEVSTDDAQVEADVVQVAPRIGGQIAEVMVTSDQPVEAGQPLVRVDDSELKVKVRQAEADLETARAQAQAAIAQAGAASATVTRAEAEAEKARLDLERARELQEGGVIAAERFDASRTASETSRAGAGANRAQYAAALASEALARARVKGAEAALDLARLQLSWTVVRAPAAGTVSRLSARAGQLVQAGQSLAQLVPQATYLVANFKETQTARIRVGQPVDVEVDAYPGHALHGTVESISGGTGARFALLPPDNASGNYVKVVERVPVRVAWASPPDVPLRAGLSATATVRTR